jgi:hypothetical membrane protein
MFSVSLARRSQLIVAVATAFAVAAMLRYPGGTALDRTTRGYSLSRNFLSDLGMTVAYNHEPNHFGAVLFAGSLLLLVVGLGAVVGIVARFLAVDPKSRRWSRVAAVALLAACGSFVGVALTPENRLMHLHVGFTMWAWRILPVAALCLGLASRHNARLRQRAALAWFGAALLLGLYAALLSWGPSVSHADGLVIQVIAQKAAAVVVVVALLIAVSEIDRAREHPVSSGRAASRPPTD